MEVLGSRLPLRTPWGPAASRGSEVRGAPPVGEGICSEPIPHVLSAGSLRLAGAGDPRSRRGPPR